MWALRRLYNMPYLLFLLAPIFWSGNFILGRLMHTDMPPVALAFWRWTGAAVVAHLLARPHLQQDWPELRQSWRSVLLLSLLGIALMNTLLYAGLQWTTVINASLIMALMPALIMLFAFLIFREQLHSHLVVGILFSFLGAYLIIGQGRSIHLQGGSLNRGDLLVLLAAAVFAAYSVAMRLRPAVHALSLMAVTFTTGALLLLPIWVWEMAAGHAMTFSLPTLLTLAYLMLFPSVVAYFCFNRCIELIGAVRAGFCIHLVPLFSSIVGALLLGEPVVWYHAVSSLLICAGIVLTTPLAAALRSLNRSTLLLQFLRPTTTITKGS